MLNNFDVATARHCIRVAIIAMYFANYLKLSELETEALRISGIYHDLGLVKKDLHGENDITDLLLTEEDPRILLHPSVSNEILRKTQPYSIISATAQSIIEDHHERYDGKGYPQKLKGDEIHRLAPILSIADYFDSILWESSNPPALGTVIAKIAKESKKRFPQKLVTDFNAYLLSLN